VSCDNFRLFRDIAQTRSISRAAELHKITPSAASQALNELERSLNTILLDRSTRPLSLTPEGQLYNEFCRDVLRRLEQFEAALDEKRQETTGRVSVAAIYSVGLMEMSHLEEELHHRLSGVTLSVEYLRPEKVYEAVAEDRADIGLVSYPEPTRELAVIPWREDEMVLAAAPGHRLASKTSIEPADLHAVPYVALDSDLPISREITRYFRAHDVTMNIVMHFDNFQTIKEAVIVDSGVSLVPARILGAEIEAGLLASVPLAPPGLRRPLGIVHRKRKRFSRAAQAIIELLHRPSAVTMATS
jgi:DNA-binding transcriptional LysR family regulator